VAITECRICGNHDLVSVLNLGEQALTSAFPRSRDVVVPAVPLEMVVCAPPGCGLVQLRDETDPALMYNEAYGYRSGIRPFMVNHLRGKVAQVTALAGPGAGDLVLDIGSNDSTLLHAYPPGPALVGFDPSGAKFSHLYPEGADLVVDYFSTATFRERYGDRRAKVVTSIAMFYDLSDPTAFMRDVREVLADDGVWLLEQSYLPAMLDAGAYDVVCHEHLEYYALAQIEWMAARSGLTVVSAEVTDVYGGSLCAILARDTAPYPRDEAGLARIRAREKAARLDTLAPYESFGRSARESRAALIDFLAKSRADGKLTLGYGASTKGNVILQYCGLTEQDLPCIGEPSAEKSGCFTPGTGIPIVSEEAAKAQRPDQLLVLPWIYRDGFLEREAGFLAGGGKLVFPLPDLEIV
jgi:NDP-4-keto-2,6-dideoxyhexose 3-C-methyltransferase